MTDTELFNLARSKGFPELRTAPSDLHVFSSASSYNKLIARFNGGSATPADRSNLITTLQALPDRPGNH